MFSKRSDWCNRKNTISDHFITCRAYQIPSQSTQTTLKQFIMTVLSKVDDNSSIEYGRYVTFVDTRKYGPRTLVRRSRRKCNGTPCSMKKKDASNNIDSFSNDKLKDKDGVSFQLEIDKLCSIFQTTLVVDNHSLAVIDSKTKILCPIAKYGSCVNVKDDTATTITPVKRSGRNVKDIKNKHKRKSC